MEKLAVVNAEGEKIGEESIPEEYRDISVSEQAVKLCVVQYLANQRKGTVCTKSRGEVNFSTRKPWRQKGTGLARVGTRGNPVWRKGGVVFGPKPRDFSIRVPRRLKRKALRSLLADRLRNRKVVIIEKLELDRPSTKAVYNWLKKLGFLRKTLVITEDVDKIFALSLRNIPKVDYVRVDDLNPYILCKSENILLTRPAWEILKRRFLEGEEALKG